MQKFKIKDVVKTNIHYCEGWKKEKDGFEFPSPSGIRRIRKAIVLRVFKIDIT